MKTYTFSANLEKCEDGRWRGEIPGLAGCAGLGNTREQALETLRESAQDYLEAVIEETEGVDQQGREAAGLTVVLDTTPLKSVNFTVNLPPELVNRAEMVLQEEGWSETELLRCALDKYLSDRTRRRLRRYGARKAREMGLKDDDVQRLIDEYRAEQRQQA